MPIPAIISCSLCSGVRRRAITVTCCGAGSCRSCAVKHITSSRACWACATALTTKDAISDELLRKKIDELSDSSLLLCGVCAEMCKRGVAAPCCKAKACRSCAVKVVTGTRACWQCTRPIEDTGKLVNDELLRAAVDQFKECEVMDPEHWDKLAVVKDKEKDQGGEEDKGGQVDDASDTKETAKNHENRPGKGGGWFCQVENCHNMNLAASVECFRCGTERHVQENGSHKTGQARHRRKETHVVQAEADTTNMLEEAPVKVYECPGEVICISDRLDCGILKLKGADDKSVKCFFRGQDYLGDKNKLSSLDHRLSQRMLAEKSIKANARLVDKNLHIPYLASTVWPEGLEVGSEEMSKIFRPVSPTLMNKYRQLSEDLSWQQNTYNRKPKPPDSFVDPQLNNLNWQQIAKASSQHSQHKTSSLYKTPSPPALDQPSRALQLLQGSAPARGRTPMPTPTPPILSYPTQPAPPLMSYPPKPVPPMLTFPPQPVPAPVPAPAATPAAPPPPPTYLKECIGIVTNLINDNYGVAAVTLPGPPDLGVSGPYLVLFDTCEFWAGATVVSDADIPLSEVTQVGDMVKINAVQVEKVNARNIKYLATAIMTNGVLEDLIQTKFHESVVFIKDVKNVSNDKLTNFKVVVDFLNNQTVDSKEKDAVEQSTKLAAQIFAKSQNPKNPSTSTSASVPSLHLQFPPPTLPAPYPGLQAVQYPLNPTMPPMMPLMAPMMPPFPFPGYPPFPATIPGATPNLAAAAPAREKVTNLPEKMIYWNDNLICNIDKVGEYIDCVYCKETVSIKVGDTLAPYYLNHYASESHHMMVKRITVDQEVIRNYLSERVMLQIQMRKEVAAGKAVVYHKSDDVAFYVCKHWPCMDLVTSAWHFQNMIKSPKHNQTGPPPPSWLAQKEKDASGIKKMNEDISSKEKQRMEQNKALNASACKDTRIRLCQVGYLIKKLNDVIFDCVVCKMTVFGGGFAAHGRTTLHKRLEKETIKLSNQEKIALYTEKVAAAKSKATMAIVQKTASITCKFSEDYTYECFLCGKKNVSVFHFVNECIGSDHTSYKMNPNVPASVNDDAYWPPSLSSASSQFDYRRGSSREGSPAEKRSKSPRDGSSRESSSSPTGSRREWEYKGSSSPSKARRSPKRSRR